MYYRILSADENVRADERFVKKDADTGITLVSRDTLPASEDGLQNKIVFDADGTLYRYDICGKPQIIGKTQKSINSIFRSQCHRTSAINEQSAWRTRKLSEVERTASVRYGTTPFGFASYLRIDKENLTAYPYRLKKSRKANMPLVYGTTPFGFASYLRIDKENLTAYPYRLKKSRKANMPLVVVFPSAGATGSDNVKTLFDTIIMLPALARRKANILIPQPYRSINEGRSFDEAKTEMARYIDSVIALIDGVAEETNADRTRIYLIGVSLGGFCVWRALRTAPEKFACALPLMGSAFEFMESGDCECASIKDVPIWIAHAANDGIVSIAHDDLAAKKLTELNASFRYTRSEKYGHFLAARFLLKEKWCDWMFRQRKHY